MTNQERILLIEASTKDRSAFLASIIGINISRLNAKMPIIILEVFTFSVEDAGSGTKEQKE